jgi:hypothetical protein
LEYTTPGNIADSPDTLTEGGKKENQRMNNGSDEHAGEVILTDLIRFLHQEAPVDKFFAQIERAESLAGPISHRSSLVECIRMAMAIHNRLELQQQRAHGLLAVIESAQDLSSHLNLLELLRAIASKARNLLASQFAWISVYNPEVDQFQAQVTDGAIFKETDRMATGKEYGVLSMIISTGLPFSTSDYLADDRFPHDPRIDAIFRSEGITSVVGVPLLSKNEVIGLLFVADRYSRSHTALEISILCTLATHAAVAINTAKAFDLANKALKKGDIARAALEVHSREVQSAAEAHEQLTTLLAQGASLTMLCNKMAQLLDARILVVDEGLQIICQNSADDHDPASIPKWEPHGERSSAIEMAMRESRRTGQAVIAYNDGKMLCRVACVIGGADILGAILLFRGEDLGDLSVRTLERSASLVGIVLLSQERLDIHKSRDVAALLRGLLLPHQYEWASTLERAGQFDLNLEQPLSLLLLETNDLKATYIAKRLRAVTSLAGVVLDEIDSIIAVVCSTHRVQDVVQTCTRLLAGEFHTHFRGVLSKPATRAEALPVLYTTLRRALFVSRSLGVKGILGQNELALYSVLFETQDEASLNAFLETTIGPLLAHDRKKSAELTSTLLSYFDANRNARVVAKRMSIHVNTVRQRLTTIEEMLGHLGNPTRTLEIHMALRLWALSKPRDLLPKNPHEQQAAPFSVADIGS